MCRKDYVCSLYAEAPTPTNDIRPVASHDQLSYSDPVHTTATITSPVLLLFYSSSLVLVLILVCGSISCRLYAFSQTSEQSRDAISDGPVCSLETGKLRDRPLFQGGINGLISYSHRSADMHGFHVQLSLRLRIVDCRSCCRL